MSMVSIIHLHKNMDISMRLEALHFNVAMWSVWSFLASVHWVLVVSYCYGSDLQAEHELVPPVGGVACKGACSRSIYYTLSILE